MHAPESLAFVVKLPIAPGRSIPLFDIWHIDPCRGSSDDSCGWTYPRLTDKQRQAMRDLGFWESRERHFLRYPFKKYTADVADRETLYRGLVLLVARVLHLNVSYEHAAKMAAERFAVGGCDGLDGTFCWLPGYHSNSQEDRLDDRAHHWAGICGGIARELLRAKRRWWQHPRWHVHHWKIQWTFVRSFSRARGAA